MTQFWASIHFIQTSLDNTDVYVCHKIWSNEYGLLTTLHSYMRSWYGVYEQHMAHWTYQMDMFLVKQIAQKLDQKFIVFHLAYIQLHIDVLYEHNVVHSCRQRKFNSQPMAIIYHFAVPVPLPIYCPIICTSSSHWYLSVMWKTHSDNLLEEEIDASCTSSDSTPSHSPAKSCYGRLEFATEI
jgi:hypothetical protein